MLEKIFGLQANNTNVRTELVAGVTTFLAMAYILAVNPLILSNAGMDNGAVFVATCLSAAIGTYIMAFVANLPIAQAPGMGMNAFFAFSVVLGMGYSWQSALAGIFCSGILFLILSFSGIREKIITAIPHSLKIAVGVGIGFFIAFIGLKNAGIVVGNPDTLVAFGDIANPQVLLAIFGLVLTLGLMMLKQRFAIFVGMIITAIVGLIFGLSELPTAIVSMPPSIAPTLGQVFSGFAEILKPEFLLVIFAFLFVDFFDTAGTLMAVASRAGLLTKDGQIKNGSKAMISDALSTTIGAVLGTSSVTSYVESMTGVEQGGRTGLTAATTATLFLVALFFSPVLVIFTSAVTAPALIIVGGLMAESVKEIDWIDQPTAFAAFFTIVMMILTASIAQGIAFGFMAYVLLMAFAKRMKEVNPIMYGLFLVFIISFLI